MIDDFRKTVSSPLRIGISSRALFDLEEEHRAFEVCGPAAYMDLQRMREREPLKPGTGFAFVQRLLALDEAAPEPAVEVVILSRSPPPLALRIFAGIEEHALRIATGSFTCGRPMGPFATAWGVDLFLSHDAMDVRAALSAGIAAAQLATIPTRVVDDRPDEVRIALDADSVVFGSESDRVFAREGLQAFHRHETILRDVPMEDGPFGAFFRKVSLLRRGTENASGGGSVRIAIVTARGAPAHARILRTLQAWDTEIDEIHMVGSGEKGPVLAAFDAHIFFDDNPHHVANASGLIPAGHVPIPAKQPEDI